VSTSTLDPPVKEQKLKGGGSNPPKSDGSVPPVSSPPRDRGQKNNPRKRRKPIVGLVTKKRQSKTFQLTYERKQQHPKYGKLLTKKTKIQVHDEEDIAREGDLVAVVSCRPISKTKRHRLISVKRRGKGGPQHVVDNLTDTTTCLTKSPISAQNKRKSPKAITDFANNEDMDVLSGWTANWRDHTGPSWGMRDAGKAVDSLRTPPSPEALNSNHDVRLQLFSPDSQTDAALFACSFRRASHIDGNGSVEAQRFNELTWEFGCTPSLLWELGLDLVKTAQGLSAQSKFSFEWTINYWGNSVSGSAGSISKIPSSLEDHPILSFRIAYGDLEWGAQFDRRFGGECLAFIIWPAEVATLKQLDLPCLISCSQPQRFHLASILDVEAILERSLRYLEQPKVD